MQAINEKETYKIDIAVLLIFFTRDQQLGQVFEAVKKARPSRLYLYQDGPRAGRSDDLEGINRCRSIVDDTQIDWDCEVHRFYQTENFGCDPSEYIAQKWMFATEEMGIVLEDDDVPSQSFFPFCKELLERYKDNTQINMICGMNNTGVSKHIEADYLFSRKGSIWGWASWRRVLDTWDEHYTWLDDEEKLRIIKKNLSKREYKNFIKVAKVHRDSGRAHYESIFAAAAAIDYRFNIVPKYNMISNIGISQETTHSVNDIRLLPKRTQKLLYMKTYDIEFPLKHPNKIKRDYKFEKKMAPSRIQLFFERIEGILRLWRYQGFKAVVAKIKKKRG